MSGDNTGDFPLIIRLFGPFEVRVQGRPLPQLRSRKGKWLLALLLLRNEKEVERTWLAGILWPDSMESQSLANLRLTLTDLRTALGPEAVRIRTPSARTLRFNCAGLEADVLTFDRSIVGSASEQRQAVALYRGPLLEGCTEEWALAARAERERSYLKALTSLAAHARQQRDSDTETDCLRLILKTDPYRESALCELLEAYAVKGNHASLTAAYREFRLRVHQELGSDVHPDTTALYRRLALQTSHPNSATLKRLPTAIKRLPVPLTSLIGRKKEVDHVTSLLRQARLVTLTGTGGVGKTRLAIQSAEECADDFSDGLYFIPLAALVEENQIVPVVIAALGLHEKANCPTQETLGNFLQERTVLLVLDNCEHLIEATAVLTDHLLAACPQLRILVTSREPLRLPGEQVFRVPSLPVPDAAVLSGEKSMLGELLEYPAVHLFVERARAASAAFRLGPQNASAIVTICRRLDGIPLALELAATRITTLTAQQIATRLDDCFALLTGGSRIALPRHRTLQAALDWSYDLLSASEQSLLQRLSVFAGDFSLEAAQAVTAPSPEFLDLLTDLVEKSLLVQKDQNGQARYRLLETIRVYAAARLVERERYENRHLVYYAWLAEKAIRDRSGSHMTAYLDMLEQELPNLQIALQRGRGKPRLVIRALRLATALRDFWHRRFHYHMGCEYLSSLIEAAPDIGNQRLRASAHEALGWTYLSLARLSDAITHFAISLSHCRTLGDKRGIAQAMSGLGNAEHSRGNNSHSKDIFAEALTVAREGNDRFLEATLLHQLGNVAKENLESEEANEFYFQSLAIRSALQDDYGMCLSYMCLGIVAARQEDYPKAAEWYRKSVEIARSISDRNQESIILSYLALAHEKEEGIANARLLYEDVLQKIAHYDNPHDVLRLYADSCSLCVQGKDWAVARNLLNEAIRRVHHSEDRRVIALILQLCAIVLAGERQWEDAVLVFGASEAWNDSLETSGYRVASLGRDSTYYEWRQNTEDALGNATFAHLLVVGRGLPLSEVWLFTCPQ